MQDFNAIPTITDEDSRKAGLNLIASGERLGASKEDMKEVLLILGIFQQLNGWEEDDG